MYFKAGAFDTASMSRKLKQVILNTSIQNLQVQVFQVLPPIFTKIK
jgi:hypothetical protein